MSEVMVRDVIQTFALIGAVGAFVQQSRSSRTMVDEHEKRIRAVEEQSTTSCALLNRATITLDRVTVRLDTFEATRDCSVHTADIRHLEDGMCDVKEDLAAIRARVERIAEK